MFVVAFCTQKNGKIFITQLRNCVMLVTPLDRNVTGCFLSLLAECFFYTVCLSASLYISCTCDSDLEALVLAVYYDDLPANCYIIISTCSCY